MAPIQDPHQPPSGQRHQVPPQRTQPPTPPLSAAQRAVAAGDWLSAARQLQQAAQRASSEGQARQAAHCEQMAASLLRAGGSLDEALAAAEGVVARDPASPAARFAAGAERAQTLQAQGDDGAATQAWRQSLAAAEALSLPDWAKATVLRSLAGSEARAGTSDAAWRHFDEAATLMSDDLAAPAWVDVEQAQAARGVGQLAHARDVLHRARVQARLAIDPHLRAEVQRTLAECALDQGTRDESARDEYAADDRAPGGDVRHGDVRAMARDAARLAHLAREAALEAVAPLSYFAAAVALARAADQMGDRTEAYRVTASAWVTLADLLGQDLARSWIEPVLLGFKLRWGDAAFADARAAHERQRRDTLRRTD